MFLLPIRNGDDLHLLLLLGDAELSNMRERNPVSLDVRRIPENLSGAPVMSVTVVYADADDIAEVTRLVRDGKPFAAAKHACRGLRALPDDDQPVVSLTKPAGDG